MANEKRKEITFRLEEDDYQEFRKDVFELDTTFQNVLLTALRYWRALDKPMGKPISASEARYKDFWSLDDAQLARLGKLAQDRDLLDRFFAYAGPDNTSEKKPTKRRGLRFL
jgi:hypothetical protein